MQWCSTIFVTTREVSSTWLVDNIGRSFYGHSPEDFRQQIRVTCFTHGLSCMIISWIVVAGFTHGFDDCTCYHFDEFWRAMLCSQICMNIGISYMGYFEDPRQFAVLVGSSVLIECYQLFLLSSKGDKSMLPYFR